MMKQIKIILILTLCSSLLSACCSMNSEFECPMKPGIRCESLDQVNARVDRGEIGKSSLSSSCVKCTNSISRCPLFYKGGMVRGGREPLRYGETVMRVWVAPYEDTSGNYHQESDIFTVVKPAHWIGYPPKESKMDEG